MEHPVRRIVFFGDDFHRFYGVLDRHCSSRVDEVLFLIDHVPRVPVKFLKHLQGIKGLYEIRVRSGRNQYRVFCCFGTQGQLVLLNAFRKTSARTPIRELIRAQRLMDLYRNENV